MKTRIKLTSIAFLFGLFILWYGGADLLERNILNAYFILVITCLCGIVYMLPYQFKDDD